MWLIDSPHVLIIDTHNVGLCDLDFFALGLIIPSNTVGRLDTSKRWYQIDQYVIKPTIIDNQMHPCLFFWVPFQLTKENFSFWEVGSFPRKIRCVFSIPLSMGSLWKSFLQKPWIYDHQVMPYISQQQHWNWFLSLRFYQQ